MNSLDTAVGGMIGISAAHCQMTNGIARSQGGEEVSRVGDISRTASAGLVAGANGVGGGILPWCSAHGCTAACEAAAQRSGFMLPSATPPDRNCNK